MSSIEIKIADKFGNIILNRPDKRNALNGAVVADLQDAFDRMILDDAVKVILLSSVGKVFSAGADLGYLQSLQTNTYDQNLADSAALSRLLYTIYASPKVTVAAVQGHAIAGGCGLASVCDIVIASTDALFGYTEVKIGFIPAIVSPYLMKKVGETRTKFLLLSGELITAKQAVSYGLIHEVVHQDHLEDSVMSLCSKMVIQTSGESIKATKKLLLAIDNLSLEESLTKAIKANADMRATEDCKKGIAAFMNKTAVDWN